MTRINATRLARVGVLAAGVIVVALGAVALGIRVNHSPSMPLGVYRVTSMRGERVSRGMIVAACLPPTWSAYARSRGYVLGSAAFLALARTVGGTACADGAEPIPKRVVAIAGDVVDVEDDGVRVAGEPIGVSVPLARDSQGRELPFVARGVQILAPGQVWLAGDTAQSFDSRYFGPLLVSALIGRVTPIVTAGVP